MDEPHAVGKVRYRWSCQISYGSLSEFIDLQRQKAEVAEKRGWVRSRFWMTSIGTLNDFFLEREYSSLPELAEELAARERDYEFSRLIRASYPLVVQGSIRAELFEELDVGGSEASPLGERPA